MNVALEWRLFARMQVTCTFQTFPFRLTLVQKNVGKRRNNGITTFLVSLLICERHDMSRHPKKQLKQIKIPFSSFTEKKYQNFNIHRPVYVLHKSVII